MIDIRQCAWYTAFFMGDFMRYENEIKELLKIAPIIDATYVDILDRKDGGIETENFKVVCVNRKGYYGYPYDRVTVEAKNKYSITSGNRFLNFYSSGSENPYTNILMHDSVLIGSTDNECEIQIDECRFDDEFCIVDTIPYDKTCSVLERKLSVDLAVDNIEMQKFMNYVIDFQEINLTHINLVEFVSCERIAFGAGTVYNEIISRPFFKRTLSK